jgi:electron transfer flavoprotein alpha subunit
MKAGVAVIAEIAAGGLTTASREVISFAGHLAKAAGEDLLILIPGHFPDINQPPCYGDGDGSVGFFSSQGAEEIGAATGCDVACLYGDHLSAYSAEAWVAALSPICGDINPRFICIPHTSRGWDYGPGLAVRLEAALIGAVEGFRLEGGNILFKRSCLKGQWQMDILPEKRTTVLTILPDADAQGKSNSPTGDTDLLDASFPRKVSLPAVGAEPAGSGAKSSAPQSVSLIPIPSGTCRTTPLGSLPAPETAYVFSEAQVIVAAGRGIGAEENISLIKHLAGVFPKSAVGCSRYVCDQGWMEYRHQIGMTGKTVTPALYIACGISGAMPHLAGMKNSRSIVAVNRDKDAAIFQVAHLGIVEDLMTFIPAVLELWESRKQERCDE